MFNSKVTNAAPQFPQVSNQIAQVSNQVPQISNQVPQVSNQVAQVSNQVAQVSDQVGQVSNQVAQVSNQVPQMSNQIPQVSNQVAQVIDHPERSYYFKIPDSYSKYDNDYWEERYHNEDDIDVGNTIKMSKKCDSNWRPASTGSSRLFLVANSWVDVSTIDNFCEVFSVTCKNLDPSTFRYDQMLLTAHHTLDGYTTVLNCPQCGCTDGTYDVENFFQIFTG